MHHRPEEESDHQNEHQAAEQGVTAGKKFSAEGLQLTHWPHAGQNHGGVGKCVNPGKAFKEMVTCHANSHPDGDQDHSERGIASEPREKDGPWREGRLVMFGHGGPVLAHSGFFPTGFSVKKP
ncbi:MAG: hypothetical protein JWM68_2704 [Verrucomicrobiales bacterium]|nr:hypothetical protein [Verrucomicrobiales bacterium]